GAEVVNVHAAELGHRPIRDARRNPAHDEVIHALLAPATHQIVALLQHLQKFWNLVRIVLQITVHGDEVLALRVREAGSQGRRLPEIPAQLPHYHAAVNGHNFAEHFVRPVHTAVVDEDQLKALAGGLHHGLQTVVKSRYALLLIVKRNYDRILRHS